jgi:hypothetical protein
MLLKARSKRLDDDVIAAFDPPPRSYLQRRRPKMDDPIYVYFGALAGLMVIGVGAFAWGWLASRPYIKRQDDAFRR